jgi:hypothetical protein
MNETIETNNNIMGSLASRTRAFLPIKKRTAPQEETQINPEEAPVVIVGAGIVGLVLALALHKHVGIKAELYEKALAFHDDVGAGMGMYPNGLRVIRDIDPELLAKIQSAGYPYLMRRLEVRKWTKNRYDHFSIIKSRYPCRGLYIYSTETPICLPTVLLILVSFFPMHTIQEARWNRSRGCRRISSIGRRRSAIVWNSPVAVTKDPV